MQVGDPAPQGVGSWRPPTQPPRVLPPTAPKPEPLTLPEWTESRQWVKATRKLIEAASEEAALCLEQQNQLEAEILGYRALNRELTKLLTRMGVANDTD